MPHLVTFASSEVGSSQYMIAGYLGDAIMEKYDVKVRVVPFAEDISKMLAVRVGHVDIGMGGTPSWIGLQGLERYAELAWGPQGVQMVFMGHHPGFPLAVRGDSDIYTAADLRGKRVGFYIGGMAYVVNAHLVFAGLTWDDVEAVQVPGYTAALRMVMEGTLDSALLNPTAPIAYEFAGMPYGVRYIPLPAADTEGWERIREFWSLPSPFKATRGTELSEEKPLETLTYPSPTYQVYPEADENMTYFVTKAFCEAYDIYAAKSDVMKAYYTIEGFWDLFDTGCYPVHKGSVRYFKEIGQWTAEREAKNQERNTYQAELRAVWDATVDLAVEQGIKAADFPEFWLERRAAAGF